MTTELPQTLPARYGVVRMLGKGATATTWLAEDRESASQVAIKILDFRRVDEWKHVELFEREARALAALDHEAIPTLRDFFEAKSDDGVQLVVVQDYIDGTALSDLIDDQHIFEPDAVEQLARGLLGVLDYLHQQSPPVVHRDIKPSNVIVGASGDPVLVDFGGVCFGWREPGEGSTFIATHGYSPPEQYMGQVSTRSDLYAVGATLIHVLSGRRPSDFSFETGRIEVPEGLAPTDGLRRLVTACLSTAPQARPATAALALALLDEPAPTSGALVPREVAVPSQLTLAESLGDVPRGQSDEFAPVLDELARTPFSGTHAWGYAGATLAFAAGLLPLWWTLDPTVSLGAGLWLGLIGLSVGTLISGYMAARLALANLIHHQTAVPQMEVLLHEGTMTRGIVTQAVSGRLGHAYEICFEAHGEQQTLHQRVALDSPSGHRFRSGDPVDVLFAPGKPVHSVALLAKSSTAQALTDELGPVPRAVTSHNDAIHDLVVPSERGTAGLRMTAELTTQVVIATALGAALWFLPRFAWWALMVPVLSIFGRGFVQGLRGLQASRRRELYQALFRDGRAVTGVVLKSGHLKSNRGREAADLRARAGAAPGPGVSSAALSPRETPNLVYRFDVGGEAVLGQMSVSVGFGWWFSTHVERQRRRALEALHPGDPVLVLYDPDDPSKSCCVPHPIAAPDRLDTTLITHQPV